MPTRCNRWFLLQIYCLLNVFRAPLCPSSGAREYYTDGCCLWYFLLWVSSCRYGVDLIYPASYKSSPHLPIPILKVHFNIVPSTAPSSSKLYLSFKSLNAFIFSPTRATCPAHLIVLLVILLIFGKEYKHEVPHGAFFSSLILIPPSWIQVIFPTPCSRRYSVHVFQLIWGTKFHTHAKQHEVQSISNRKLGILPELNHLSFSWRMLRVASEYLNLATSTVASLAVFTLWLRTTFCLTRREYAFRFLSVYLWASLLSND